MNAHVGPAQTLKFRAQSLLAYVLEPVQPLDEWFTALDGWLARSPTFFIARPVILDMAALDINPQGVSRPLKRPRAAPHPGYGGGERRSWAGRAAPASGRLRRAANRSANTPRGWANTSRGRRAGRRERANRARKNRVAHRGGQRALRPDDHACSGRRDDHWPGRLGRGDRRGRIRPYLRSAAGQGNRWISGSRSARIFCTEATGRTALHRGAYVTAENITSDMEGRSLEARLDGDELKLRILS